MGGTDWGSDCIPACFSPVGDAALLPAGAIDFNYIGPDTGSSQFTDYLSVAGVVFDLIRDPAPADGFSGTHAYFTGAGTSVSLYTGIDGRLVLRMSSRAGGDAMFGGYRRSADPGPSADPRPGVLTNIFNPGVLSLGSKSTLTVQGAGLYPLTYQWMRNGLAIAGATAASYVIESATAQNGGNYTLTISNAYGSVTSSPVAIAVNATAAAAAASRGRCDGSGGGESDPLRRSRRDGFGGGQDSTPHGRAGCEGFITPSPGFANVTDIVFLVVLAAVLGSNEGARVRLRARARGRRWSWFAKRRVGGRRPYSAAENGSSSGRSSSAASPTGEIHAGMQSDPPSV